MAVTAGEGAADRLAVIGSARAAIVTGSHSDHLLVAGVVHALIAVAGGEEGHAALAIADRIVNRRPSGIGQEHDLVMHRIAWLPPATIRQPPATGDHVVPFWAAQTNALASFCEPRAETRRIGIRRALGTTPEAPLAQAVS